MVGEKFMLSFKGFLLLEAFDTIVRADGIPSVVVKRQGGEENVKKFLSQLIKLKLKYQNFDDDAVHLRVLTQ